LLDSVWSGASDGDDEQQAVGGEPDGVFRGDTGAGSIGDIEYMNRGDLNETELWLIDWFNQHGSFASCFDPKVVPVMGSFMVFALAKAIDERFKKAE